jgi:chromosome segregation ATPase
MLPPNPFSSFCFAASDHLSLIVAHIENCNLNPVLKSARQRPRARCSTHKRIRRKIQRLSTTTMASGLPVVERPGVSTIREKRDGELRYIEATKSIHTILTELATRRALAQENDARIATARDYWRQRMSIEDDQAMVDRANNEMRKSITKFERCTQRVREDMKELETDGPNAMKLTEKGTSLLKDIGNLSGAIEALHPTLNRIEVRHLNERVTELEDDLTEQSERHTTETRALYKQQAELESKCFGLQTAFDWKTREEAQMEQQNVELRKLQKLHSDDVARHKKSVEEWKAEKSQLQAVITDLRGVSVNNDRFVDLLQKDIKNARSKPEALTIDRDAVKEELWGVRVQKIHLETANRGLSGDLDTERKRLTDITKEARERETTNEQLQMDQADLRKEIEASMGFNNELVLTLEESGQKVEEL